MRLASILLTCLGLSVALQAVQLQDIAVTTLVSDYDTGIAPALQIQSDKAGTYVNSRTLQSMIYKAGSWEIDSYNVRNATRQVYVAFTQPIAGTGPGGGAPIAPATGNYLAHVTTECFNYNTNPLSLTAGQSISCPMAVRFDAGGKTYAVHMNPQNPNWAGTNPVTIACIFPTSGSNLCSQWRITPSTSVVNPDGSVTYRSVGQLDIVGTKKGATTFTKQGQFYFSFVILMTNP